MSRIQVGVLWRIFSLLWDAILKKQSNKLVIPIKLFSQNILFFSIFNFFSLETVPHSVALIWFYMVA